MVDLRHLSALAALAHEPSLRRAAGRVGVAPATVGRWIDQLETTLCQQLVRRDGGGAELTSAGRLLAEHAEAIGATMRDACEQLDALAIGETGAVRVGAIASGPRRLLVHVLVALARRRPRMQALPVDVAEEADGFAALAEGAIDGLLCEAPVPDGPFDACELLHDPRVLLVPAACGLAERAEPLRPQDIDLLRLVVPRATLVRERVLAALRACGVQPRPLLQTDEPATAQAFVRAHLAAAIVPLVAVDADDPGTVAIDLRHLIDPSVLVLATRRDAPPRPALVVLRETARAACAQLTAEREAFAALLR